MTEQRAPVDAKAAFGLALALAAVAALIDNGAIGWIVGPICLLLCWFAIFRAPLKSTMLTLMFFALVLENPSENPGAQQWSSFFARPAAMMLAHLKSVIGGWMFFSGMDLMLLAAIAVVVLRGRAARGGIATPKPMIRVAQLTYLAIAISWFLGRWRGGDNTYAVWQIDRVMYLPAIFLLCQAAFTGPKDYLPVGKVVLAAGVLRSLQAIYVRATIPETLNELTGETSLPYATTHNDSMLFAVATVILVALVLERVGKKATRLTLWLGPILMGGMLANNRRMVWVEIILVMATLYLMTEMSPLKRKINKIMLIVAPIVLVYIIVGWGSQGGVFKPVQVIRSAVDSSSDTSTAWRDLENFNLIFTLRQFPIAGLGYGHGFWEMWPMPAVDYSLERYVPHNSILGLLCYGGWLGYMLITALWVAGIFFGIRSYHNTKVPLERAASLASFGSILVYYLQCFGDMGLGSWTGVFLVGPSIAIACKLTVKNDAWQLAAPERRAARPNFAPSPGVSS